MGREKLLLPGVLQGEPDIPLEMLLRTDLISKFLEITIRIAAGATPQDAARVVGVTFNPELGEEAQ